MASVKIPEHKIILCGEFGVGKSSLFRRYAADTFITATDRKSTLGLDHYEKLYKTKSRDVKLQLWDTGGMERVASITSSYYKFSEAAILVFALDNPDSFNVLSQHLLDVVTYAENAKIFLCGNKYDLKSQILVSDADMETFSEQCHNLISGIYKTSCKTGEGVEEMFADIASKLGDANRSRKELDALTDESFKVTTHLDSTPQDSCLC
ncbi:ras-related protein ORAB-1 [Hyalella azteca]|uniref:Ras-related protein ORAB-1 n=1 Tax=Hyalella azteca TaxID=294128 RepID=A0A8B7P2L3_HYAAZ|nr:ras-related protein ORAB-1 [Hyalella azteca]